MSDQPDDAYSLVMPFIACQSQDGPYEDDAFVAGYQAGQIDRSLAAVAVVCGSELQATVNTALVPQLDLVAMNHGFQMEAADAADAEGWTFVTFRRSS